MSQLIVPLTLPKSRHSEKKSRNEILMKIRLEKVELTFFHSINQEVLETILDKVLFYDNPAQGFRSRLLGLRENGYATRD